MRDVVATSGRPTLDKPRSRRDASKVLGIALQTRYRKLLEATGEDETVIATADLAQCMYENVEFVIWALKSQGGMNPPPPEILRPITPPQRPANDQLESPAPAPLDLPCTCPPLEHGLLFRDKHMTSCPKFVPA